MNYKEVARITKEIEKKEKKLSQLADQADKIHNEMEELHDNLQSAIHGDMSYMEIKSDEPETELI